MNKQITKKVVATFTSVATVAMLTAGAFMPITALAFNCGDLALTSNTLLPNLPAGVAANSAAGHFAVNRTQGRVWFYPGPTPQQFQSQYFVPGATDLRGIAVGGTLVKYGYVVDAGGFLWRFQAGTSPNPSLGNFPVPGGTMPVPAGATSIAVNSFGDLFVVAGTVVYRYDGEGNPMGNISWNSGLSTPFGIAIDSQNNVWLADPNANAVRKFNASGNILGQFTVSGASTLTFGPNDELYVENAAGTQISILANGTMVGSFPVLAAGWISYDRNQDWIIASDLNTSVLKYYYAGAANNCPVAAPTDLCTNLPGDQATMPAGYADPDNDKVCNTTCALDALTAAGLTPASLTAAQLAQLDTQCTSDPTQVIVVPKDGAKKGGIKPNPTGTCFVIVGEGANVSGGIHCQKQGYCDVLMASNSNVSGGIKDMKDVYINGTGVSVSGGIHNAASFILGENAEIAVSGGIKGITQFFKVLLNSVLTASGGITCAGAAVTQDTSATLTVSGAVSCGPLVALAMPSEGSASGNLLALAAAALAAGLGIGVYARRKA